MGPSILRRPCWNMQKKACLRFWKQMETSSKFREMLVKIDCGLKIHHIHIFLYFFIKSTWHIWEWENAGAAICQLSVVSVTVKLLFSSLCCRIFLSLMEAADLTDLLKQEGDFTLFAPSDMAFAGLSNSDLEVLKSTSLRLLLCSNVFQAFMWIVEKSEMRKMSNLCFGCFLFQAIYKLSETSSYIMSLMVFSLVMVWSQGWQTFSSLSKAVTSKWL